MTDVNDCIGRPPDSGCQNKLALLAGALRNFCENRGGNIVVTFALALAPTLALTGAAVDYSRANADRAAMQSALDSTSLAMAKDAASLSAADLQTKGLAYFNAQFKKVGVSGVAFNISYSSSASGPKVVATASASVKNMFMNLPGLGFVSIPIAAGSTVAWSNSRLRVALALDNTGSMADSGKMTALKVAAKALIDQLKAASTVDGDVYVSIIPFAKDVNSGPSNYIANWLSWTSWDDSVGSPKNCDKRGNNCTWVPANHNTWNGCVTDRDQTHDADNAAPTGASTYYPAEQDIYCPVPLMTLSYNWTALKSKIDSMSAQGYTNTTIGLAWAWDSLTQGLPLSAPTEDPKYIYTKVIIFLTDGENTENRFSGDATTIDKRMTSACVNAKAAGITIYTILVLEGNQTLLQGCASDPDKYFKLTASSQLVTVFSQIGTSLAKLHVAK